MEEKDLIRLFAESQNNLTVFLKADAKLGLTFAEISKTKLAAGDWSRAARAFQSASRTAEVMQQLLGTARLLDAQDRTQIENDLRELNGLLAEIGPRLSKSVAAP